MKNLLINNLKSAALNQSLAPAWIFTGNDHDANVAQAYAFSQWLLCNERLDMLSCGKCKACSLFTAKSHPDFCPVYPQEDKSVITIDAIRSLRDFNHGKAQLSQYKIALIYPAQTLHKHAANALLKTLEEPGNGTIFILIASHSDLLPKTIVSRCQILNMGSSLIIQDEATAIIRQMVADLSQLWIKQSVTCSQIVESWIKQWAHQVLYWFDIVLTDIIRFKYTGNIALSVAWCDEQEQLSQVLTASKFWAILERLREAQFYLGQNYKPNLQLVLEDMLLV